MKVLDIHLHLGTPEYNEAMGKYISTEMLEYYRSTDFDASVEKLVEEYRRLGIKATPVGWDSETTTGSPPFSHDSLAAMVKEYPDVFVGAWACVDPWKGEMALKELDRVVKELGLIGAKFQQGGQNFAANDRKFYPIWEKCVELNIPVQIHSGSTGLGAGSPGGLGIHLKYYHPLIIDDIAADFPKLTIIALHPSWPWQSDMIAVLLHKANVYNDLSGWRPKYFDPELLRNIDRLQDKFMFGTENPLIFRPEKMIDDLDQLGLKPEVVEKILYKNAERVLNLKAD